MFGLSTRSKTQQPPEARRQILAAIAAAEASTPGRLAQLRARVVQAQDREAQARRDLEVASRERAQLEGEQFAASAAAERQVVTLRRDLAAGAPAEIAAMQRDVAALADAARLKAQTMLTDGYQGLDGRHAMLVSTNTDSINGFLLEARQVGEQLEALKLAEVPDLEQLGPFAELSGPVTQFERARRYDDAGAFVDRPVIVPAALAARYAEIAGIASPKELLSPGEARETEWAVEREAQRRRTWEPWR